MKSVFYYDTPIGRLGLAENGRAVTDVLLHGEHPADAEIRETPLLQKAAEQLAEYFGGLRTEFELPLEFEIGTPFERTVWQALSTTQLCGHRPADRPSCRLPGGGPRQRAQSAFHLRALPPRYRRIRTADGIRGRAG